MAGSNRGRVKRSGKQRLFGRKPLPVTMPAAPITGVVPSPEGAKADETRDVLA